MDFDYVAWVPCLTGRLFLSHTNCGLGTRNILAQVNHIDVSLTGDIERYLLLSSEVDWQDTPGEEEGRFTVILAATSPATSLCLRGYLLLIPTEAINKYENWESMSDKIRKIDKMARTGGEIGDDFRELYNSLLSFSGDEIHKVYFTLGVDGLAYLSYIPESAHQLDDVHAEVSVRQAFYYLKYSIHKHQHHHSSDDSLTTVHPIQDDSEIGPTLIEDLKRALVTLKRNYENIDHSDLSDAQGVTAYALSLAETLKSRGMLTQQEYEREVSYFNNIRHSLDASAQRLEREIERNVAASGYARSIILFVLAILGPLAVLYKDAIIKQDTYYGTSDGAGTGLQLTIKALAHIFSSDTTFSFFVLNLVALYWLYNVVHSRYGTFALAFRRLRYIIEGIVKDPQKGAILYTSSFIIGALLILLSWMII